jgi:hypothetical protein
VLLPDEGPLGFLEKTADEALKESLRPDLRALGLAGTVVLLARPGPADPEVAREAALAVKRELALGEGELEDLLARYAEKKGPRGRELARKLVGRTLHDLYGLQDHGLVADDVTRALDLAARCRGEGDAREVARGLARSGKAGARVVLGHLEEQIQLVHRLATEELMPSEIDKPLVEFAPRIFSVRLPSILKLLLPQEPRVRLVFVLWGRLRGLTVSRESLLDALDVFTPEEPGRLVETIAKLDRAPLLSLAGSRDARVLEDAAFLA